MTPRQGIGHYDVTSKLGEGGMGAVYRATDTRLNRDVAIKVLPDAFAADPDRVARFTREAQVLASLNHPNIAAIYGVEGRALVLELVEGAELKGPLSEAEALPIVVQLIDALEYAHDKGIVHRDLKPANLKITSDGRLKVLDFGLAKAFASDPVESNPANSPTLTMRATMAGAIIGTAAYMAPEQARGQNADRRADIWAFGAVVYELLTGKVLFDAPTVSDTLAAVLTRSLDFDAVPPRFRRLLRLCLERDLRQRLSHISAARVLLDPEQTQEGRVRRGPWLAAVVASTVVALAAVGFAWRRGQRELAPLMRLDVDLGPDSVAGGRTTFALTPDGTAVLYRALNPAGKDVLAFRRLSDSKPAVIPQTDGLLEFAASPDSQWVAFNADGNLRKAPLNGGTTILLAEGMTNPRGIAWASDGSIIFASSPTSGLLRVPPAGGKPDPVTDPAARKQMTHRYPQFLPGRQAILFTAHNSTAGLNNAEIDALDLKNGQIKTVVKGGFYGRYLPSGHLVFVHDGALLAARFDVDKLDVTGAPVPVLGDLAANLAIGSGRFAFAPATGLFAYIPGTATVENTPVSSVDASGKRQTVLTAPLYSRTPALSPNGRYIALSVGAVGDSDVQVWDSVREGISRITFTRQDNRSIVWAPDGKHLVYVSEQNGGHTLWWARADGGSEPQKLLERPMMIVPASFTPDGRRLGLAIYGGETLSDLWTVPMNLSDPDKPMAGTPEPFLRTQANEYNPIFSPDGRWITYTSEESGHPEVYVRPFPGPGGKWQISTGDGAHARWSRDMRRIFFMNSLGQLMVADCEIQGAVLVPGKPRPWGETRFLLPASPSTTTSPYDISPDGKRVIGYVRSGGSDTQTGARVVFLLNFFDELKRRIP